MINELRPTHKRGASTVQRATCWSITTRISAKQNQLTLIEAEEAVLSLSAADRAWKPLAMTEDDTPAMTEDDTPAVTEDHTSAFTVRFGEPASYRPCRSVDLSYKGGAEDAID